MISEVDGVIDSEFVGILRSEGIHDADVEDEESVEERIITASLKMIRKSKKTNANANATANVGRGLHERQRHRWKIDLRREVRGREFQAGAYPY